jgi:hypothetical protein
VRGAGCVGSAFLVLLTSAASSGETRKERTSISRWRDNVIDVT